MEWIVSMGYYHMYSYLSGLGCDAIGMDDRVRCLSYLMRHIVEFSTVPSDVRFELFVPQYPAPVPAIGLTEDPPIDGPSAQMRRTARHIGEDIEAFCNRVGLEKLLESASRETICWSDLLARTQTEENSEDL